MRENAVAHVRKARFGFVLLAAFSSTLLTSSPAKANTTLTGPCPVVITQPGDYSLGGSLVCAPNVDGIDILTSNVTLNLNHTRSQETVAAPHTASTYWGRPAFW